MTDLKEYEERLKGHDWTYTMSDSASVYKRNAPIQKQLEQIAKESPEHKKLYDKYHAEGWGN